MSEYIRIENYSFPVTSRVKSSDCRYRGYQGMRIGGVMSQLLDIIKATQKDKTL